MNRTRMLAIYFLFFMFQKVNAQTPEQTSIKDIDGNTYPIITIGNQVWMQENLKTTKFNDGTPIPEVKANEKWTTLTSPAFSWYNNNRSANEWNGAIYNWYVIETNKLCPSGWHVPTDNDWQTLELTIGLTETETETEGWRGDAASKLAGEADLWLRGSLKTHPEFGNTNFVGLPAGNRIAGSGSFGNAGSNAYWWTATEHTNDSAWIRNIYLSSNHVIRSIYPKQYGFPVRCIKD